MRARFRVGIARFSLSEPGDYDIEFSARDASPKAPRVSGCALGRGPGTEGEHEGRIHEWFRDPRDHREPHPPRTISSFGPVDVMLRLTEEVPDPAVPGVSGLPRRLEFVAVEGGPAPARQTVPVLSDTGADWQIRFAPVQRACHVKGMQDPSSWNTP